MQEIISSPVIEQGSYEWHQSRIGKFTASEIYRLMGDCKREMTKEELDAWKFANPKSTAKNCVDPYLLSDGAMTYVMEVASERITGVAAKSSFDNEATRHGKTYEPIAKQIYSLAYDVEIQDGGIFFYGDNAAASPDGLIGEDTGMEFKCPISPAIHLAYRTLTDAEMLKQNYPNHYWQCMTGLLTTRRLNWKFISFHAGFTPVKQLKVLDVPRVSADLKLLDIKLIAAENAANELLKL